MTSFATSTTTLRRRAVALLAAPLLVGALAACGSSDAPTPPANSSAAGGTGSGNGPASFQEWQLKNAACLRTQGIHIPDADANGNVSIMSGLSDGSVTMDQFIAAAKKCRAEIGEPPARSAPDPQQVNATRIEQAKCLREQGAVVEDPAVGKDLDLSGVSAAAQQACGVGSGGPQVATAP